MFYSSHKMWGFPFFFFYPILRFFCYKFLFACFIKKDLKFPSKSQNHLIFHQTIFRVNLFCFKLITHEKRFHPKRHQTLLHKTYTLSLCLAKCTSILRLVYCLVLFSKIHNSRTFCFSSKEGSFQSSY